jgi:hypothetical protein
MLFLDLGPLIRSILAPLIGVYFASQSIAVLYIFNLGASILGWTITILLTWMCLFIVRARLKNNSINVFRKYCFEKWDSATFLGGLLLYSLLAYVFVKTGEATVVPDSTQFEGVGRLISQGGRISDKVPWLSFLVNGRLLVIGALHALNRLFGAYALYGYFPLVSTWFLIFLGSLILTCSQFENRKVSIALTIIIIASLGCYKNFYQYAFMIHSNITAMIYFSSAIISVYVYSRTNQKSWLFFGSLSMGVATLVRTDMLLFSLVFLIAMSSLENLKYSILKYCLIIFFLVSLPWRALTLPFVPTHSFYVNTDQILLLIFLNICVAILMVLSRKYLNSTQWLEPASYIAYAVLTLIVFIVSPEIVGHGWNLFVKYIMIGYDNWLSLTLLILLLIVSYPSLRGRDPNLGILISSILLFFVTLFYLVGISGYEFEDHSANRMVLHILPVVIFVMANGIESSLSHLAINGRRAMNTR